MERRDFLVAWIHLLLISLFPWLRPKPEAAQKIAEKLVSNLAPQQQWKFSIIVKGYEVDESWYRVLQENPDLQRELVGSAVQLG